MSNFFKSVFYDSSGQSGVSGYVLSTTEDGTLWIPPGGASGFSGFSGYSGKSGFSGVSGYSGANPGASGFSGYSGISGFSGVGNILNISGNLTSTDILSLNTSPIQLIASPGPGFYIQVISWTNSLTFVTTAYDTNTNLMLSYNDFNPVIIDPVILSSVSNNIYYNSTGGATIIENSPLEISVQTGNPLNGDGTINYYINYQILSV